MFRNTEYELKAGRGRREFVVVVGDQGPEPSLCSH
jgi:hypothetical protein